MASLLLCLLLLPARAGFPGAAAPPPVCAVGLEISALTASPSPLAADTLVLAVECEHAVFYKLGEGDAVLATGKFLPGANALRFTRPGLTAASQTLCFVLDLLEQDTPARQLLRLRVKVADPPGPGPDETAKHSGTFRLDMYHRGRLFGFREKSMVELLELKTGPVRPVPDPGLGGAVGRNPAAGQSVSVLGLGMALAKYLAGKKNGKSMQTSDPGTQQRSLTLILTRPDPDGQNRAVHLEIELHVE